MALYIPISRRRRNAALIAAATLVAGLIVGFAIGRTSAVTAAERAADVRSRGDTMGSRLEALTIEYEQTVAGTTDTLQGSVIDALDLIDIDMKQIVADAPWLGPAQIAGLTTATAAVRSAAEAKVPPTSFAATVDASAKTVRDTFGVKT